MTDHNYTIECVRNDQLYVVEFSQDGQLRDEYYSSVNDHGTNLVLPRPDQLFFCELKNDYVTLIQAFRVNDSTGWETLSKLSALGPEHMTELFQYLWGLIPNDNSGE